MADSDRTRLLVLGARGQLGWELSRTLAPLGEVCALDRTALDLLDSDAIRTCVRAIAPQVIVNAAAYTEVDRAETEPELAWRINADAPATLATEASQIGALLVHYSTDYVFDGMGTRPYTEQDAPAPRTAYGAGKLRGDQSVLDSAAETYIFRIGWVYGRRGRNFLRTMQRLASERDELRVVADQYGGPTWSRAIAEATALAVGQWLASRRAGVWSPPRGIYHMAPPDHTSWHGFASAIVDATTPAIGKTRPRVKPITTTEYPTRAARPTWSVLDGRLLRETFGLELPSWRDQLAQCMDDGA